MSGIDRSEVFLVDRDAHPDLATLNEDFWMFDEQRVAVMRYDEQERFVEAAEPTEPKVRRPLRAVDGRAPGPDG